MSPTVRARLLVSFVTLALSGCGPTGTDAGTVLPPDLPLASSLVSLTATGGVTGTAGKLIVTLGDLVRADTVITLASSNPAVVNLPASATVLAWSDTVAVPFDSLAPGLTTITATLGSTTLQTNVRVVPSVQVTYVYGPGRALQVGAAGTLTVSLNVSLPSDVTVTLGSSNPGAVGVPPTAVVRAFSSSVAVPLAALAPGTSVLTAQLEGSRQSTLLEVVASLSVASLSGGTRLETGAVTSFVVYLDGIGAADTTVTLGSTPASTLSVPATVVVPAGSYYAYVPVVAASPGTATVTAECGGVRRSLAFTVVSDTALGSVYLVGGSRLPLGASPSLYVSLDALPGGDVTVSLTSSAPSVISVPSSAVVLAGNGSSAISVPVTVLAVGQATITVQHGTSSRSVAALVVPAPVLSGMGFSEHLLTGVSSDLALAFDSPALADTPIALASSDPAVLSVPAAVTMQAGNTWVYLTLTAGAAGSATLTATAAGVSRTAQVKVVGSPSVTSIGFPSQLVVGGVGRLSVYLDVSVPTETAVTLGSTSPSTIAVPASALVPAGQSSVELRVSALAIGSTILTAGLGPSNEATLSFVVATAELDYVGTPPRLQEGAVTLVGASLSAIVAADTIVSVSNSDPAVVSAPSAGFVAAGNTYFNFPLQGLGAGTATITLQLNGSRRSFDVVVVENPAPAWISLGSMKIGGSGTITVGVDALVASDTTLTLSQSNAAVLALPATITIPSGRSSFAASVTGLSAGTTEVSATLNGTSIHTTVTVEP